MKKTFAAQTFNSKTFACGDWQGVGVTPTYKTNTGLGVVFIDYSFAGNSGLMEAAASAIVIEPADDGGINVLP